MLERKDYESLNCIDNDIDVCKELEDGTGYICDAISETADSNVSIYNNNLWENAPAIRDYIEAAIEEGLVDTSKVDLMKIFQAGEYEYYTQLLYDNLKTIIYNIAVEYINKEYPDIEIDEDDLENVLDDIDNNDDFDRITEAVDEFIEDMQNEEEEGE